MPHAAGTTLTCTRTVKIRDTYDVLVLGGGTAGVIAALASARNGARTALVERNGFLGGTLLQGAGPLHSFFNLYKAFPGAEKTQVVRGIPSEFIDRMTAEGYCKGHLEQELGFSYDSTATLIDRNGYKFIAQQMLLEAGVRIYFGTLLTDAFDHDGEHVAVFETKNGPEALVYRTAVDCSGDGDLAVRAGCRYADRHADYPVGYPFGMSNVDLKQAEAYFREKNIITQLAHTTKEGGKDNVARLGWDGKQLEPFRDLMERYTMWGPLCYSFHKDDLAFINSAGRHDINPLDPGEYSDALIVMRQQIMHIASEFRAHLPGFKDAWVSWTPDFLGVRRTRVIECDHDLTSDEIKEGTRFQDEVAVYGFHDLAPKVMIKNGAWYGVPYSALRPAGLDHILVAGRMITSTFEAHMSTRNTVSCMAQGQAAGTAAALCARLGTGTRELPYPKLREALLEGGVFLD